MAGPGAGVMILETGDDDRVPTEEEVAEYAEYLSIDPKTEPHLLWIAAEGVVAAVPSPWKACTENGDDVFYFNFETGESLWDHPCDEKYRLLAEESRKSQERRNTTQAEEEKKRLEEQLFFERRREEKRSQAQDAETKRLETSDSEDSEESALTDEAMMAPLVGMACEPYSRDLPALCISMDVPTMAGRDLPPMEHNRGHMRTVAEQANESSNISEVSEAKFSIGDSLEFSATMQDYSMASVPAAVETAKASPLARLLNAQDEMASLERALTMLQKIRGQQREYLQLLKPEGCL